MYSGFGFDFQIVSISLTAKNFMIRTINSASHLRKSPVHRPSHRQRKSCPINPGRWVRVGSLSELRMLRQSYHGRLELNGQSLNGCD